MSLCTPQTIIFLLNDSLKGLLFLILQRNDRL
jgi:hypothetical protein